MLKKLGLSKSYLKNEIHRWKILLNTIMTSPSSKAKTTNTESTLHEKFDCQEASNKLGKVNYCIDELTDYQLPSLHKSFDYCSTDQSNKNKNVIQDKDIQPSPNNGDDNSKNYL